MESFEIEIKNLDDQILLTKKSIQQTKKYKQIIEQKKLLLKNLQDELAQELNNICIDEKKEVAQKLNNIHIDEKTDKKEVIIKHQKCIFDEKKVKHHDKKELVHQKKEFKFTIPKAKEVYGEYTEEDTPTDDFY